MVIVVDTNVVMQALFQKERWSREVLRREFNSQGDIQFAVSPPIQAEYFTVLADLASHPDGPREAKALCRMLSNTIWRMKKIEIKIESHYCTEDHSDDMFVDCAIASKARYIITDNTQHFQGIPEAVQRDHGRNLEVLGPYQFIKEMDQLGSGMALLKGKYNSRTK